MGLIRQVILESATRKKDKSVSLRFTTSLEQSTMEFMEIDEILNTHGILYFKEGNVLTDQEIKEMDSVDLEVEGKTKSQRLRNVIYIMWSQSDKTIDFNNFYSNKMESIIEHFKTKLNEN